MVAVLDTGVRAHPWLDVDGEHPAAVTATAADGFIAVDDKIQDAIRKEDEDAEAHGDRPRQVIRTPGTRRSRTTR